MPSLRISEEEFTRLFNEISELTTNFSEFPPEVLTGKPSRILVLRVMLGLSQERFEAMLGRNRGNITKYETGIITTMRPKTASSIIKAILKQMRAKPTLDNALNNLKLFKAESDGWFQAHKGEPHAINFARKGAISLLASQSTLQEREVVEALGAKGIVAKTNFPLDGSNTITGDVYIGGTTESLIQCRRIRSLNRDTHRRAVEDLAYQGFRVRKYLPNARILAYVESDIPLSNTEVFLLNESYDSVIGGMEPLLSLLLGV